MEFRDLKQQYQVLKPQMDAAIQNVLTDCNFISGQQVKDLEAQLAAYVGVKHCITCGNGTDALTLMMMAWDVKPGDAVFVPDFTFFATGEVVSFEGATPVFVDVDADTYNMNPACLEVAIQKVLAEGKLTPKAVIPVDLFGLPANFDAICPIAKKYGLKVLEDGAQGFGGTLNGKRACSFGDGATTSFFPAKPLGCYGDGGAVFTNDDETAAYLRSVCVHGKGSMKYDNVRLGMNSRLDTVQAAILQVKLDAFQKYELTDVNQAAEWYTERLQGKVKTPIVPEGYGSSWAQYTIQLESRAQRDAVQAQLKQQGIPTMVYYPKPMHTQLAFAELPYDGSCPVTERLCDTVLALPMHPYLTEEQAEEVAVALLTALKK
ncbi:MAG: DegT/DnrJ/EryC1/StrS family aminotransferase [Oscillospiraceae bacterium]